MSTRNKIIFLMACVLVVTMNACKGVPEPVHYQELKASESEIQVPLYITIMTPVNDVNSTNLEYNSSSSFCYGETIQIGEIEFKIGVAGEQLKGHTFEEISKIFSAAGEIKCGDKKIKYSSDDSAVKGPNSSGMNRFEFRIVP